MHGLGEFAYRNGIDLRGVAVTGPDAAPAPAVHYEPEPGRPLIPFGGGIDSIVTVESALRATTPAPRCAWSTLRTTASPPSRTLLR